MLKEKTIEVRVKTSNRNEAEEVLDFIEELDSSEQKEFMLFLQGARFAKTLAGKNKLTL